MFLTLLYRRRMINCAFLFIPVPRMKKLVHIKVGVYFAATIAFVAWTLSLSGSVRKTLAEPATVHGSEKSWLILKFFFLGLASCGTFISNASDLQRYASRPNDVIAGQVFSFPMSNFLVGVFGNLIAAASKSIFGEVSHYPSKFDFAISRVQNLVANSKDFLRSSGIHSQPWICLWRVTAIHLQTARDVL
jgi:NCS1 family nucleobase:cation symporter-1